jgi:hypothetical protein
MKKNYTAKIYGSNNKLMSRLCTARPRVFLDFIRSLNWKEGIKKVYLRVFYGRFKDTFGKKSAFLNEGFYTSQKKLMQAYEAFNEVQLD